MANVLANIAGFIGGPINAALGLVSSTMQAGFKAAIQYHKEGIAFARDVGLSAQQAQAYTKVLIERTQELANTYGVSSEAIMQIQRGITEATGKQILLNNAQAESFVQIDKMMGAQSRAKFTEEIINGMGGQVDTVTNAMAKVYATAAKQGLNAKKLSEKVAQNLSMANRLSFRNGIDGITRMAALSEKLGFNMKSVETAAEKFLDIDKAIENAAQMQMLGGSAAVSFGNPLTAAYEANYDPETFAKRMTDSLASYATFDTKTGLANVNGMNMDFVRAIGQKLGIGTEEATRIAKKQSEVRYKENKFMPQLNSLGLSEDQKNFIINNAQVTNGGNKLELNGKDVRQLTQADLAGMMQFEGKSDRDILEQQAKSLISIDDHISGAASSVAAGFADGINKYLGDIGKTIQNIGSELTQYSKKWGSDVGNIIADTLKFIKDNGPQIKTAVKGILDAVTNTMHFISGGGLKGLLLTIGAVWFGKNLLAGSLSGGASGVASGRAIGNIGKGLLNGTKSIISSVWKLQMAFFKGTSSIIKGIFNFGGKLFSATSKAVSKSWSLAKKGGSKLSNEGKTLWSKTKGARTEFNKIKTNAKRSYTQTLNKSGSTSRAINNTRKNIWKNLKNSKNIKSLAGRGLLGVAGAAVGMIGNSLVDNAVENGKIKRGGLEHYGGKMASTAAEFASISAILGPMGAGVGAAVGAIKGAYDTWKSLPENADKNFIDYAKSVGESIVDGGKAAFNWVKEKVGPALSSINKEIQDRGGYLTVAFNAIFTPIRMFIKGIESLFSPLETIKKFLNWWNSDNKVSMLLDKTKDLVMGEKHANGGIVGGTSYTGDKITGFTNGGTLFGVNSGEMILNKQQQANLFTVINNLPKLISNLLGNNRNINSQFVSSYKAEELVQRLVNNNSSSNINSQLSNVTNVIPTEISNILTAKNDVKAKPVGEREYIYIPNRSETSNINGNQITVKDFNINLSGTIKLDGGNNSKDIDVNALLQDYRFIGSLKEIIKSSINNDMNFGRFMNDRAAMNGQISSLSTIGR